MLFTITPGELGQQVTHTRLVTPNTQPSVPPGQRIGAKRLQSDLSAGVPVKERKGSGFI